MAGQAQYRRPPRRSHLGAIGHIATVGGDSPPAYKHELHVALPRPRRPIINTVKFTLGAQQMG